MKDIKLLEKCEKCGEHLTLMESQRYPEGTLWAVKRCLNCGGHPAEEVARLYSGMDEDAVKKQDPIRPAIECDDEFICPACGKTTEDYDVTTIKFCPECGQKLRWD
jgi:membrane protease subunit (stomatin/prohibitin family)